MKVIYDSKEQSHRRVIVLGDNGEELAICGCFKLEIETTLRGEAREHLNFARWGNQKERAVTHKAIQKALDGSTKEKEND